MEKTPYISNLEKTPYISNLEKTPYISNLEKIPYISNLEKTPYISNLEKTPYISNLEKTPYISNLEKTPYISSWCKSQGTQSFIIQFPFSVNFHLNLNCIYLFRSFPESVRWLNLNKKTEQAELILRHASVINQKTLCNVSLKQRSSEESNSCYSYVDLIKNYKVFKIVLIQGYIW